jgi:Flp pilus assembly protein TadD
MSFNKTNALKLASKYLQQGKLSAAIAEYRKIVQADPHDITTLNILGDLYAKVGDKVRAVHSFVLIADEYSLEGLKSKAIAMLKKASKLDPDNAEVAFKLGALYTEEGLWAEAQQQYLAVAEKYLRTGKNEEAFSLYQKIVDLDPANTDIRTKLAEAYLQAQRPDQAYEVYVAAASDLQGQNRHEEALKIYLKALKAKPEGREALVAAINLYLQRAETQPAESLLKHLLRTRPNDTELLNLLARVHQAAHDLKIAKRAISQAVELDPSCFEYQVDLVSACDRAYATFFTAASEWQRQGNQEEALQAYLKALRIKPESQAAASAAVTLYLQRGDTQAAVMLIRHLLRARPDNAELLSLLSQVYYQAQDYDAAEQTIGRAVTLDPASYQEVLDLASLWLRGGELDRVLRLLDYVLEILYDRHEEEKAIELLHEVLARDTNHLGALERLVAIYARLGRSEALIETLTALAHAAVYKGQNNLAISTLHKLIQLQPDEVWHRRLLNRLGWHEEAAVEFDTPPVRREQDAEVGDDLTQEALRQIAATDSPSPVEEESDPAIAESGVVYFPEYNCFDLVSNSQIAEARETTAEVPLAAVASDQTVKAVEVFTGPSIEQLVVRVLPEEDDPQLQPEKERKEVTKEVISTTPQQQNLRAQPVETVSDCIASSDEHVISETVPPVAPVNTNLLAKPVVLVNIEVPPGAFSSNTVWRSLRSAFRKRESPARLATRRGSARSRYRRR